MDAANKSTTAAAAIANDAGNSSNNNATANWSNSVEYWEGVAESVLRVTAAGFAGSLIGLAKERLDHHTVNNNNNNASTTTASKVIVYEHPQQQQNSSSSTSAVQSSATSISSKQQQQQQRPFPRRPPQLPIQRILTSAAVTSKTTNLPLVWSISCMLFTIVLETSRLASPTNIVLRIISDSQQQPPAITTTTATTTDLDAVVAVNNNDNTAIISAATTSSAKSMFQNKIQRTAITSFGDYTLGGTIAGLAGAMGQRQRQQSQSPTISKQQLMNRIPTARFGLATGLGLGMIAGMFQAAIDVSNLYIQQQQQQQQVDHEKQQQEHQKQEEEHQKQQQQQYDPEAMNEPHEKEPSQ